MLISKEGTGAEMPDPNVSVWVQQKVKVPNYCSVFLLLVPVLGSKLCFHLVHFRLEKNGHLTTNQRLSSGSLGVKLLMVQESG